jgi:hypothetical protein
VEGKSKTTFLALGPRSARSPGIVVLKRHGNVGDLTTNLINLKDAYLHEEFLYLLYEYGDISLDQVHPSVPLGEEHISIICREVSDWQNHSCLKLFDWYRFCTASHIFGYPLLSRLQALYIGAPRLLISGKKQKNCQLDICWR